MKRQLTHIVLIGIVLLMAPACSIYDVRSQDVSTDFYPPKEDPGEVQYMENVRRRHEVLGYVTVNTERNQPMDEILQQMKKEAAILGGDAITNIRTNAGTGKWARIKPKELLGNAHIRANYIATVVVLK